MFSRFLSVAALLCINAFAGDVAPAPTPNLFKNPGIFIDTFFENASPLRWDLRDGDVVELEVIHDHERLSPISSSIIGISRFTRRRRKSAARSRSRSGASRTAGTGCPIRRSGNSISSLQSRQMEPIGRRCRL